MNRARNGTGSVPVTMGSRGAQVAELDGLLFTHARFPAGEILHPHVHERATFAVMLGGSFDLVFARRSLDCRRATVFTEPAGERHANRIGSGGAEVVVIQPDPECTERCRPFAGLLDGIHHFADAGIARLAARIPSELRRPDEATPLALEGIALEMLAAAVRLGGRVTDGPPRWLRRAREIVHDRFRERLRIADIANEVGVHPAHLGRAFRARYGTPIGACVRELRLAWAADRLADGEEPLGVIAQGAGFADHSHFTRAFRRWSGRTPGEYRRAPDRPAVRRSAPVH